MDKRLSAISEWIYSELAIPATDLRPASSDASFRRYFRLRSGERSYIVMDAPPQLEDVEPFLQVAAHLRQRGLNVPEILSVDRSRGFVLMTDLGTETYLDRLNDTNSARLYADAIDALLILQTGTQTAPDAFPPYNEALLKSEMQLFPAWYARRHLDYSLGHRQETMLERTFEILCRKCLEQPQVWVHRDYHSRNLMVTTENNPGILDFQDAVIGPITYDLVSLLRDCYIEWPRKMVLGWALDYHARAIQTGLPVSEDPDEFLLWFDYTGVQRHIKVLGIFARLFYRDGKANYLGDLPLVWRYLMQVCEGHADLHPFRDLLQELRPTCTP